MLQSKDDYTFQNALGNILVQATQGLLLHNNIIISICEVKFELAFS